jgi:hypothetical protein
MWMKHYNQLYNSVVDDGAKETFYQRLAPIVNDSKSCEITVYDVTIACSKEKCGKAIGFDEIAMEALIHGGPWLHVHISILFSLLIKLSYVPKSLVKCVTIPLVKYKSGDLTDVNN